MNMKMHSLTRSSWLIVAVAIQVLTLLLLGVASGRTQGESHLITLGLQPITRDDGSTGLGYQISSLLPYQFVHLQAVGATVYVPLVDIGGEIWNVGGQVTTKLPANQRPFGSYNQTVYIRGVVRSLPNEILPQPNRALVPAVTSSQYTSTVTIDYPGIDQLPSPSSSGSARYGTASVRVAPDGSAQLIQVNSMPIPVPPPTIYM